MGFCHFCWREADKLKKEIEYYQQEVGVLNSKLILIEEVNKSLKKGNIENIPKNKTKMITIVREALIARNMREGEADNLISLLLK